MLVNVPISILKNPITTMVARIHNRPDGVKRLSKGLYEIGHWNFEFVSAQALEQYPELDGDFEPYGVCDTPEQLIEKAPWIEKSERKFCVSFVHIKKCDQSHDGGWRWKKWGSYIGDQSPEYEYLYHESNIESVYTFHIYEVKEV